MDENINFVFYEQAVERDFWCAVPTELEPMMNLSVSEWRRISQPENSCTIRKNLTLTHILHTEYLSNRSNDVEVEKCTRFVFDTEISSSTIQSEWNVVCEDSTLLNLIEMCFLAGAAIGKFSEFTKNALNFHKKSTYKH